ncbi:hypothetical protein HDU96_001318 [Phlyctochytrium bullatum]|nr:hypothetical protein HDU96_001318 [Phlyctochytrium bullatum]
MMRTGAYNGNRKQRVHMEGSAGKTGGGGSGGAVSGARGGDPAGKGAQPATVSSAFLDLGSLKGKGGSASGAVEGGFIKDLASDDDDMMRSKTVQLGHALRGGRRQAAESPSAASTSSTPGSTVKRLRQRASTQGMEKGLRLSLLSELKHQGSGPLSLIPASSKKSSEPQSSSGSPTIKRGNNSTIFSPPHNDVKQRYDTTMPQAPTMDTNEETIKTEVEVAIATLVSEGRDVSSASYFFAQKEPSLASLPAVALDILVEEEDPDGADGSGKKKSQTEDPHPLSPTESTRRGPYAGLPSADPSGSDSDSESAVTTRLALHNVSSFSFHQRSGTIRRDASVATSRRAPSRTRTQTSLMVVPDDPSIPPLPPLPPSATPHRVMTIPDGASGLAGLPGQVMSRSASSAGHTSLMRSSTYSSRLSGSSSRRARRLARVAREWLPKQGMSEADVERDAVFNFWLGTVTLFPWLLNLHLVTSNSRVALLYGWLSLIFLTIYIATSGVTLQAITEYNWPFEPLPDGWVTGAILWVLFCCATMWLVALVFLLISRRFRLAGGVGAGGKQQPPQPQRSTASSVDAAPAPGRTMSGKAANGKAAIAIGDVTPISVASTPTSTPDPDPTPTPPPGYTPADVRSFCAKDLAMQLTSIFETSSPEFGFGVCTTLPDDHGYSAGFMQVKFLFVASAFAYPLPHAPAPAPDREKFTTGTGSALRVIETYLNLTGTPSGDFVPYLPALRDLTARFVGHGSGAAVGDISHLHGFCDAWRNAAATPAFRLAQLLTADALYWTPSQSLADTLGLTTPATRGQIYDSCIQLGVQGTQALAASVPAAAGANETAWLLGFLGARRARLVAMGGAYAATVTRVEAYEEVVRGGDEGMGFVGNRVRALDNDGKPVTLVCNLGAMGERWPGHSTATATTTMTTGMTTSGQERGVAGAGWVIWVQIVVAMVVLVLEQ